MTYPQNGKFPRVGPVQEPTSNARAAVLESRPPALIRKNLLKAIISASEGFGLKKRYSPPSHREIIEREQRKREWKKEKRDLSGRANGTIDPWYGCELQAEIEDYALNFSLPWSMTGFSSRNLNTPSDFAASCQTSHKRP